MVSIRKTGCRKGVPIELDCKGAGGILVSHAMRGTRA